MRNWSNYNKEAIFKDKTRGGLLSQFLKEYQEQFNVITTPGCRKCLDRYFNNYLKLTAMAPETNKCDYELHKKYNGIQLGTNGQPIRNGEMTNEIAKELLEKHPHGAKLFSIIPAAKPDKEPVKDETENEIVEKEAVELSNDEDLTLKELRGKYPETKAASKADFLERLK